MSEADRGTSSDARARQDYAEMASLVGGFVHELKNPLSTIRLNLEILSEEFAEAESQKERRALAKIDILQRELQRLQDVLDDFLNFAKVRQLKLEDCGLNELVSQVSDFFRPQAAKSNIDLVHYLGSDLPPVRLDREVFRGALLNLLLNAQQAMPEGGEIVLRTSGRDGNVLLEVIDNGCGMDAKTREHVFEAFFSTKPTGSGLGLPTARKIIEQHGGSISVQSEEGRGTQFTITLPAAG